MTMPTPTWGSNDQPTAGLGVQSQQGDLSFVPAGYEPPPAAPAYPAPPVLAPTSYSPYPNEPPVANPGPEPYAGADPYAGAGYPPAGQGYGPPQGYGAQYAQADPYTEPYGPTYQGQYYSAPMLAPYPGMVAQPPPTGLAVTSMVLGIVSFVFGGWLIPLPIAALVTGIIAVNKANRGEAGGKGMAITGIVLGALAILGGIALIGFYLFALSVQP